MPASPYPSARLEILLALVASTDGSRLAVSHGSGIAGGGTVRIYRLPAGELERSLVQNRPPATCLAFAPGGSDLGGWEPLGAAHHWPLGEPPAAFGAAAADGPPAEGPDTCPPAHQRRFTFTALRQVNDKETFFEDTRTGLLVTASHEFLKVTDVPRRGLLDRLLGRYHLAGFTAGGELVAASFRPRYPLVPVELGLIALVLLPRLVLTAVRRRSPARTHP